MQRLDKSWVVLYGVPPMYQEVERKETQHFRASKKDQNLPLATSWNMFITAKRQVISGPPEAQASLIHWFMEPWNQKVSRHLAEHHHALDSWALASLRVEFPVISGSTRPLNQLQGGCWWKYKRDELYALDDPAFQGKTESEHDPKQVAQKAASVKAWQQSKEPMIFVEVAAPARVALRSTLSLSLYHGIVSCQSLLSHYSTSKCQHWATLNRWVSPKGMIDDITCQHMSTTSVA